MGNLGTDVRPEELSSKEHGGLWPFKVDLAVEIAPNTDPITYTMFLRAPNINDAMYAAVVAFDYYEHERPGIASEFPRISDSRVKKSILIGLDEDQYMEFWKEAQRSKYYAHAGNRKNPSWFRFVNDDDWAELEAFRKPKSSTIIVPDVNIMSSADIKAKKAAIDKKLKK